MSQILFGFITLLITYILLLWIPWNVHGVDGIFEVVQKFRKDKIVNYAPRLKKCLFAIPSFKSGESLEESIIFARSILDFLRESGTSLLRRIILEKVWFENVPFPKIQSILL